MRRAFLLIAMCLLLLPCRAQASERAVTAEVRGQSMDAILSDGCTYVPLRCFVSALDADGTLTWEGTTRSAVASCSGHYLTAEIGKRTLSVDGTPLQSPVPLFIRDGASYIPLRLAAEALGLSVRWDSERRCAVAEGIPAAPCYTEDDYLWMARIIHAESGGEPLAGQIAVGNVVLNRVKSREYADSIYEVIFEICNGYYQFEPAENGHVFDAPDAQSFLAAAMVLAGFDAVGECQYFYAPRLSGGTWIRQHCRYVTTIGCHDFYV